MTKREKELYIKLIENVGAAEALKIMFDIGEAEKAKKATDRPKTEREECKREIAQILMGNSSTLLTSELDENLKLRGFSSATVTRAKRELAEEGKITTSRSGYGGKCYTTLVGQKPEGKNEIVLIEKIDLIVKKIDALEKQISKVGGALTNHTNDGNARFDALENLVNTCTDIVCDSIEKARSNNDNK